VAFSLDGNISTTLYTTSADWYCRTLCATEREFEAYLILVLDLYPRALQRLQQSHSIKRTSLRRTNNGDGVQLVSKCNGLEREHGVDDYSHINKECNNDGTSTLDADTVWTHMTTVSIRLKEIQREIDQDVLESQQSEIAYRELGARLSLACSDGSDSLLVNALFKALPLLLDRVNSSHVDESQTRALQSRNFDGTADNKAAGSNMLSVFPARTSLPTTSSQSIVHSVATANDISEYDSSGRSYVIPFLDGGRWQVAISRAVGKRTLIDPWGFDGSRPPHVGSLLYIVLRAHFLTLQGLGLACMPRTRRGDLQVLLGTI
jgi:hypothetical protein